MHKAGIYQPFVWWIHCSHFKESILDHEHLVWFKPVAKESAVGKFPNFSTRTMQLLLEEIYLKKHLTKYGTWGTQLCHLKYTKWHRYPKVVSRNTSWLVAHSSIFRMFMKGKFDAYVLWFWAKSFQNWTLR